MKRLQSFASSAGVVAIALATALLPTYAQSIPAELETNATDACTEKAEADGFAVDQVRSVSQLDDDTVNVVLDLTRDSQAFKLTCGYSVASGEAAVGDSADAAPVDTYQPWISPWLWLLLPLIGLPLLLFWAGNRRDDRYARGGEVAPGGRSEALVKTTRDAVDIHAGAGTTHQVTGTLRDGQRVTLSGRRDNDWVELADGGWVPLEFLETNPRLAR